MMRLGILGGTFDPVHNGHLAIAAFARDRLGIDRLLLIPARRPPHKGDDGISSIEHRLAMVELACADVPRLEASPYEASRPGPSYTVETLSHFRVGLGPGDGLFFVLGSDSLADLPSWREPDRILELASLAVAPRPGVGRAAAETAIGDARRGRLCDVPEGPPAPAGAIYWLDAPPHEISGSDIRRRVREGREIKELVPAPVAQYISRCGLYR
jgi:nicotinate-nucleotide adenylyltransferase